MYLVCLLTHSIIGLKLSEPQMKRNIKKQHIFVLYSQEFTAKIIHIRRFIIAVSKIREHAGCLKIREHVGCLFR